MFNAIMSQPWLLAACIVAALGIFGGLIFAILSYQRKKRMHSVFGNHIGLQFIDE